MGKSSPLNRSIKTVFHFIVSVSFSRVSIVSSGPLSISRKTHKIMARRSSGGRSAGRSAPRPRASAPPPAPAHHAPPPAPAQRSESLLGGIGSTIAQGMAFGTGSAMAHRAVEAVMGPRTIQHETVPAEAPASAAPSMAAGGADSCNIHSKAFQDCINNYGSDISKCQFYLDMLNECRRGSGSMLNA